MWIIWIKLGENFQNSWSPVARYLQVPNELNVWKIFFLTRAVNDDFVVVSRHSLWKILSLTCEQRLNYRNSLRHSPSARAINSRFANKASPHALGNVLFPRGYESEKFYPLLCSGRENGFYTPWWKQLLENVILLSRYIKHHMLLGSTFSNLCGINPTLGTALPSFGR